MYYTYIYI